MDQVTQQNAAMVEEATAASHSLAQEAEELSRLMGQFRVGAKSSAGGRMAKGRATAPQAPVRTARVKVAAVAGGQGRRASEDAWDEF
jgi:methyl-accepting chemotaxis protein